MATKNPSPLRNAKGDTVNLGCMHNDYWQVAGWRLPTKRAPQGALLMRDVRTRKSKLCSLSEYGLTFTAPAKPTRAEKANVASWAGSILVLAAQASEVSSLTNMQACSMLLQCARLADNWVKFIKLYPHAAAGYAKAIADAQANPER